MNDPVDQQQVSESHSGAQFVGTGGNCHKVSESLVSSRKNALISVKRCSMPRFLLAVLVFVAIGSSVYAQQSDPFAPAQPLADGWEKMDERLIFLMVRLLDVEANLDAVDAAIAKVGGRAASARSAVNRAEAGSDRMDRRAGGPVRWDKFYGTTAEKFFYHPTQNHSYHTQTILSQQSPSNDNQSESGVPSRQGLPVHQRPPQFDYMYRANEHAKERATAEVAKIANKVDALAARRAELEIEQSKLWCEVAFRVVSRNDLDKKPLYRFMPKGSGQESLTAAASFVVVALSIVKSGESDQGGAFRQIKPMVSKARSELGDKWLQLGVNYQDQSSDEWKFATLARHLEDVSSNLSDSYAVSVDSARNSDNDRRDMYRGLLQKSLVQYAEAVLALNEMASEMAKARDFAADLGKPIAMPTLDFGFADTATYPPSNATGSLPLAMQEQTKPADTPIFSNPTPDIAIWSQLVGQYQGSGDDKLELSVNQQGHPQLRRGEEGVSKSWRYVDGKWLFNFGDIDLFSVAPEQGESIRLNVYWRANQDGFANARLPERAADRSFLYTKSSGQTANIGERVSYLKNLDLRNKIEEGQWQVQRGKLVGVAGPNTAKVSLGTVPFDHYDLVVDFTYVTQGVQSDLIFHLPRLERSFCIRLTKEGQTTVGFFGGKGLEDKRLSTTLPGTIALRTPHKLIIKVRSDAADIFLDGKAIKSIASFEGIEKQGGNSLRVVLWKADVMFNSIDVVSASIGTESSRSSYTKPLP